MKYSPTDADGNVYHTVAIGSQTWTVENLRTTKYHDGSRIPLVTSGNAWALMKSPAYCWFDNDAAKNKNTYGALYNWYAVNTKNLAPAGWHVPSAAEWNILQKYLIANGYNWNKTTLGNKIAKSMAAKTGWDADTGAGTIGNGLSANNKSGFSALPGGYRGGNGHCGNLGVDGGWWSATAIDALHAGNRSLECDSVSLDSSGYGKKYGFSVRLVQDSK